MGISRDPGWCRRNCADLSGSFWARHAGRGNGARIDRRDSDRRHRTWPRSGWNSKNVLGGARDGHSYEWTESYKRLDVLSDGRDRRDHRGRGMARSVALATLSGSAMIKISSDYRSEPPLVRMRGIVKNFG